MKNGRPAGPNIVDFLLKILQKLHKVDWKKKSMATLIPDCPLQSNGQVNFSFDKDLNVHLSLTDNTKSAVTCQTGCIVDKMF